MILVILLRPTPQGFINNSAAQTPTKAPEQVEPAAVTAQAPVPEPVKQPEQPPVKKVAKPLPGNCETYRPLVAKYGWNVEVAMNVMRAESGCNPNAINKTDNHKVCRGSYGLFQISCHSGVVYDPEENVKIAWAKYQARGWKPWGVCNSGKVDCY